MFDGALFAATTELAAASLQQFNGIPVHPGEDASAKEDDDWWRQTESFLSSTDAVHFIAGRTPPRLSSLDPVNLSGYTAVAVPAASTSLTQHLAAVEHNRKVEAASAENTRRKILLEDHRSRSATALAAALDASLRPKSRLHCCCVCKRPTRTWVRRRR